MSKTRKKSDEDSNDIPYWETAIIIIVLLLLLVGASLFLNHLYPNNSVLPEHLFTAGKTDKGETTSETRPKFVDLGTFTAHLDDVDLKTSISVKLTKAGLDGRVKASIPEIMHHVNMVLQSKQSSELATYQGKEKLARQIKEQIEYVMGFRKVAPAMDSNQMDSDPGTAKNGISDVLFTSFIIQY